MREGSWTLDTVNVARRAKQSLPPRIARWVYQLQKEAIIHQAVFDTESVIVPRPPYLFPGNQALSSSWRIVAAP